jgi:hypothetical protein
MLSTRLTAVLTSLVLDSFTLCSSRSAHWHQDAKVAFNTSC